MIADYANFSITRGHFNPSTTTGLTFLLEKKGKDPRYPQNLRPIALLNVYYKIITAIFTFRLNPIMETLTSPSQKAIKGRNISHNLFSLSQIIEHSHLNIPNTNIALLDFEKAFDRVSHDWILHILKSYQFGPFFTNFVKACLTNNKSKVILPDGSFSTGFDIHSGVRQGDTISPLIFVLTIDPIIRAINNSPKINGIKSPKLSKFLTNLPQIITKLLGYADDICLVGNDLDINTALNF